MENISPALLNWFYENQRVLPFRTDPSPYHVWLSEIMLQQTRVSAALPYYERFLAALPDIPALAACEEEKLNKLWEGLGYYSRVRNLQKAARIVCEQYGGQLPADYDALRALPGIGDYTAGAIASISFGLDVPAVDGNVLRILTRVAADDTDIMKQSFRSAVEAQLGEMMRELTVPEELRRALRDENVPGALNQAMMELGATVCVPNGAPLCEECPWSKMCLARAQGRVMDFPVKSKAKARRIEERTVLVIRDGEKVAIRKRPKKGLLAGLYELPNLSGALSAEEVLSYVKEQQFAPLRIEKLADAKHIFSHIEWRMSGYAILVEEAGFAAEKEPESGNGRTPEEKADGEGGLIFVDAWDARERYAIPSAFSAYAGYLKKEFD